MADQRPRRGSIIDIAEQRQNLASLDSSIIDRLPAYSATLFDAKTQKRLTFEAIASHLGRSEVAVTAIFYGQARASPEDAEKLSRLLGLSAESPIAAQMMGFPDRGQGPGPIAAGGAR
ncbi:hypothetical protein CHGG_02572 [Chaetomium globosum CBS 148.51]|uniref:Cyanate hydratase N-terminal domain-containing protein n=1 Tax=Chaetomium globosum (strain ATCC 6205 / CBS 148.51 / DSM 1962 / NBRC 6347 / NRRL 1970) TaxID=306901 RepID=Q2HB32_CHAGB|nr:uncharacterized protein CHGG_02572 [Chaetomium globosum CBS 148.51]EAQ90637.1 hypothetical protein CHGG_02572 [Chaetomium globosum CBS 148.51]